MLACHYSKAPGIVRLWEDPLRLPACNHLGDPPLSPGERFVCLLMFCMCLVCLVFFLCHLVSVPPGTKTPARPQPRALSKPDELNYVWYIICGIYIYINNIYIYIYISLSIYMYMYITHNAHMHNT